MTDGREGQTGRKDGHDGRTDGSEGRIKTEWWTGRRDGRDEGTDGTEGRTGRRDGGLEGRRDEGKKKEGFFFDVETCLNSLKDVESGRMTSKM